MRRSALFLSFAALTLALTAAPVRSADAPAGTKVYVSNSDSNTVSVIDATAEQPGDAQPDQKSAPRAARITNVDTGSEPRGLAASPDGAFVYVPNRFGSVIPQLGNQIRVPSVTVIDTATDTPLVDIQVTGTEPYNLAVTPDGTRVYVVCKNSSTVSVISTVTDAEVASIALQTANSPEGIAITPDGSKVYVVGQGSSTVDVISTATNTVIAQGIPVGSSPRDAAVSADGSTVIVVGEGPAVFIRTSNDTVVPSDGIDFGTQRDVAVVGNLAYVTNFSFNGFPSAKPPFRAAPAPGQGSLDIYDLSTVSYQDSIAVNGSTPYGVVLLPDGSLGYVSCQDSSEVRVIDLVAKTDTGESVGVGSGPSGITLITPTAVSVPSYLLPRSLRVKLKAGATDSFVTRGTFDDGGVPLDLTKPVTLEVGGFSRSFTLQLKGTEYLSPKESGISFRVKPNVKTSSRGKFRLLMNKVELDGLIDPNAPLLIRLVAAGAPPVRGRVKLTEGFFRIGRASGDILEPAFFPRRATAVLADGAGDSLIYQGGFATGGVVPTSISQVKVGFGPTFVRTIPGSAFTPKRGSFTYTEKVKGGIQLKVVVDFRKDILKVNAKKIELGAFTDPRIDFVFGSGASPAVFTNTVRLGSNKKGNKRFY